MRSAPRIRIVAVLLVWLLLLLAGTIPLQAAETRPSGADPEAADGLRPVALVTAPRVMAVTANPHATRAAVDVLRRGGNAVDAAVAAAFVLNVVEPQSSGIGGGGFLVAHLPGRGGAVAIDGREETPASADPRDFLGPDGKPVKFFPDRITGGRAVGVPGMVKAMELALQRYGTWPLAKVLEPAIALAEQGFPVSRRMAESLRRHKARLVRFPATRQVFFDTSGETLAEGAPLRQPELAGAFRLLASEGSAPFYTGAIARDLVRTVREDTVAPGRMTAEDLAVYEAVLREPVRGVYRDYTLVGMGPPSSGATTVFQMLGLLETRPVPASPIVPEAVHAFAQAARLAYADRAAYLGDPDFVPVPVQGMLDKTYLRERAAGLDWSGPLVEVRAGRPPGAPPLAATMGEDTESPSTTHLVVVDEARNLVSLTLTIEQAFGSGMVVPGWGFLLNNQLTDFRLSPAKSGEFPPPNRMIGGRRPRGTALPTGGASRGPDSIGGQRPRSSMAPTLVFKGDKPVLVLGSPGGSRIIQYVAEVLLRVLDHGMDVQVAISAPHHTHMGGRTDLEPPLDGRGLPGRLEALGHKVRIRAQGSGLHAIAIDPATGMLSGGADPRREGTAMGF